MFERWRRRHAESGASDDATVHLQAHCAAAWACGNTTVYRNPNLNQPEPIVDSHPQDGIAPAEEVSTAALIGRTLLDDLNSGT